MADDEMKECCPKRLRSADPDVTLIVGDKTFSHYSAILCNCSDYFDAMLSSTMKEGQTKRIEFPDKTPDEWELVYSFIGAPATTDLTQDNLPMLVPWFSVLQMKEWLSRSDWVLSQLLTQHQQDFLKFITVSTTNRPRQGSTSSAFGDAPTPTPCQRGIDLLDVVMDKLELSLQYNLQSSRDMGLSVVKYSLQNYLFFFTEQSLRCLVTMLHDDMAREELWPSIMPYLHESVRNMEPEDLIGCPLLPNLLLVQGNWLLERQNVFTSLSNQPPPPSRAGFTFGSFG